MSGTSGDSVEGGIGLKTLNQDSKVQETTSEEANLVEKKRKLSFSTGERLRILVLVVSWLSVIVLAVLGFITLALSVQEQSSAAFAFSLDALLDCVSSLVVIWRFSGSSANLYSGKREKIACITLGSLFIISAIGITTRAGISLVDHNMPESNTFLYIICIINAVFCGSVLIAKVCLAIKLQSWSIGTDAVNSGIGFVLATSTLVGERLYQSDPRIWYFDPVLGIVCSFVLIIYGIWIILYEVRIADHCDQPKEGE